MNNNKLIVRQLGRCAYTPIWQGMQTFTDKREKHSADEIWLVEHDPVFTQGQAGKEEHLLMTGDIPVVKVDRGGQVTYHGPGQQMMYVLLDIRRLNIGVRELVTWLEEIIIATLSDYGIDAYAKKDAPGVYVNEAKIASLGLRVRHGCTFHGLALNVNMDLSPFLRINPCGYAGMQMIQTSDLHQDHTLAQTGQKLVEYMIEKLKPTEVEYTTEGANTNE